MRSVWLPGRPLDRRLGWNKKTGRSEGIGVLGRRAAQRDLEDNDVEVDPQANRHVGKNRSTVFEDPVVDDDVESIAAVLCTRPPRRRTRTGSDPRRGAPR